MEERVARLEFVIAWLARAYLKTLYKAYYAEDEKGGYWYGGISMEEESMVGKLAESDTLVENLIAVSGALKLIPPEGEVEIGSG